MAVNMRVNLLKEKNKELDIIYGLIKINILGTSFKIKWRVKVYIYIYIIYIIYIIYPIGIYTWNEGRKYDGTWSGGKKHGRGISILADGRRYIGPYVEDKKEGYGVLEWY